MARTQWIAIDWDWTLWNTSTQEPMPGAHDALDRFHERGWKVVIHSCNNPPFIRKMCEEHNLPIDAIWGESPMDSGAKPVAAVYIDDRALAFTTWDEATSRALEMVADRPVRR